LVGDWALWGDDWAIFFFEYLVTVQPLPANTKEENWRPLSGVDLRTINYHPRDLGFQKNVQRSYSQTAINDQYYITIK
jgi:hypothetical protein